ncbi:DNA-binding CsgD family transcriptional regulator [Bradyrhizobium sp. USDA 4506]
MSPFGCIVPAPIRPRGRWGCWWGRGGHGHASPIPTAASSRNRVHHGHHRPRVAPDSDGNCGAVRVLTQFDGQLGPPMLERPPILSPREKQLLRRFAQGKSDRTTGLEIGGTEKQVAAQRAMLVKKLQIFRRSISCRSPASLLLGVCGHPIDVRLRRASSAACRPTLRTISSRPPRYLGQIDHLVVLDATATPRRRQTARIGSGQHAANSGHVRF